MTDRVVLTLLFCVSWTVHSSLQNNIGKSSRIVGGFQANIRAYPFVAAVNVQTSDSRFLCGGSLYGSEWVITAGQCVHNASLFTVSFGSSTLEDEDPNRLTVATSTYYLHPGYNPLTLENDIGLIKLRLPITHTDFIKSIDLLPTEDVSLDTQIYTFGWGQTSDRNSSYSNRLQVAYITPITNEECKLTYGNQLSDSMVCIAGNYNEGICHGDTGGPLIKILRSGLTIQDGIASFISSNGCESTDPSGFTRTYPYVDWIQETTGLNLNAEF